MKQLTFVRMSVPSIKKHFSFHKCLLVMYSVFLVAYSSEEVTILTLTSGVSSFLNDHTYFFFFERGFFFV